jgi:putative transferase (TIGR04331 family)
MKLITTGGIPVPSDEPVIFLGPWCDRQDVAAPGSWQFDSYFSPDKRADLAVESRNIAESIFIDLVQAMNRLHGANTSTTYWSMNLKLWLNIFVDVVFQRWTCITQAVSSPDFTTALHASPGSRNLTPVTRLDIQRLINSHEWNHSIFSDILRFNNLPQETINSVTFGSQTDHLTSNHFNPQKSFVKKKVSRIVNLIAKHGKYVIAQTYLPRKVENRLAIRLRTAPLKWEDLVLLETPIDRKRREEIDLRTAGASSAEQFIRQILPQHIPMLYVEHYSQVLHHLSRKSLPKQPATIFTSNLHMASEQFLLWLSLKSLHGTQLVLGQHGGVHGMAKYDSQEFIHEMNIADTYLSWGWSSAAYPSVLPSFALINVDCDDIRTTPSNLQSVLLLVTDSTYRYPSPNRGVNSPQGVYLEGCFKFSKVLLDAIREKVCIRLYHEHEFFDQDQMSSWHRQFPNLRIDSGHTSMKQQRAQAKVVVCTSIGTTCIETIHRNIPTVMFFDPQGSPLKPEHATLFGLMEQAGILHYSAQTAAQHINAVWHDVDGWWMSEPVQAACRYFTETFSQANKDPLSFLKNALSANNLRLRDSQ